MGGPYSGKFGVVNGISTVRDFTINDGHTPNIYSASNTLFGVSQARGVEFWDGNFNHYGHSPVVLPGEIFQFIGYGAPINNISGSGWRYVGNAICESAVITWDWTAGGILSVVENFKGHLNLTEQGAVGASISDESIPSIPHVACTRIDYSANGSDWTTWNNLAQAVLTLTCELQEYVNSSTTVDDNGTCRIWKGFRPGRVLWTLAVTEQELDRSIFAKGDVLQFRAYVSDTEFYLLKWGMVNDFTGIQVNRETGAIVQQTVNIGMHGFDTSAGSYAASTGQVLLPSTEQWWPDLGSGSGT